MKRTGFQLNGLTLSVAIVAFLGFWLLRVGTSSGELAAGIQVAALIAGLVLFVGALIVLYRTDRVAPVTPEVELSQPELARFLFASARSAPLWLGVRLYLGYEWFEAGRSKVVDPAWMNGAALRGFWERAVAVPAQGRPPITYDPYRDYIQFMLNEGWYDWFAKLVAVGQLLVGIALVLGALTAIAAFAGALMNMSFMLAGAASTNPVLFTLAILIILAWRVAGQIGLDRWLLPALGVPWRSARPVPPTPGTSMPSRAT